MTPAVIDVYSAFARNFKLGKQAEDALDKIGQLAAEQAKQPKPPDPEQQRMMMEQQATQAKLAADKQANDQKLEFESQMQAMKLKSEERELEMQEARHRLDMTATALKATVQPGQGENGEPSKPDPKMIEAIIASLNEPRQRGMKVVRDEHGRVSHTVPVD